MKEKNRQTYYCNISQADENLVELLNKVVLSPVGTIPTSYLFSSFGTIDSLDEKNQVEVKKDSEKILKSIFITGVYKENQPVLVQCNPGYKPVALYQLSSDYELRVPVSLKEVFDDTFERLHVMFGEEIYFSANEKLNGTLGFYERLVKKDNIVTESDSDECILLSDLLFPFETINTSAGLNSHNQPLLRMSYFCSYEKYVAHVGFSAKTIPVTYK